MEIINIIALIISPVIAVLITIWYQDRQRRRIIMYDTFLTLISYRNLEPAPSEFITALNTIDIVFYRYPKIVQLWSEFYDLADQNPTNHEALRRKKLDMLSEIARTLGYGNLKQTSIDKFYMPAGHINEEVIKHEVFDFLKNLMKLMSNDLSKLE